MNAIYDFTYALAKARQDDLLREADRQRLVSQAKHAHVNGTSARIVTVKRPTAQRCEPAYR